MMDNLLHYFVCFDFRAHSRAMSQMMNSMFGDFGFGVSPMGMGMGMGMDLMPFGMPMQRSFVSPFSQMVST